MKIICSGLALIVFSLLAISAQTSCQAKGETAASPKDPWPSFSSYKVGDTVLFYAARWRLGKVEELGVKGNAADKNPKLFENKYKVVELAYPNSLEWMDWSQVVSPQKQSFWTKWFIGDWKLGETMAVNARREGNYVRDEFSYGAATEALQVNENKTYKWKTADKKTITGTWVPCGDGPGIVLQKGYKNLDWTLRNQSDAAAMHIRKLDKARLFPPVNTVMGIAATRKM